MLRIVLTVLIAAALGVGLGKLQATMATTGFEERFESARPTSGGGEAIGYTVDPSRESGKLEIVGGTVHEFGMMQHGETLSHDFVFKNVGRGPLSLTMGASTCKCTVGDLDKEKLEPGESTNVKLTWTATSVTPEYTQTATIRTDDPTQTHVQLKIMGMIADSFMIEPKELMLGDVSPDAPIDRTLYVFGYLDETAGLTAATWANEKNRDLVTLEVEQIDLDPVKFERHERAKTAYELKLHIEPGLSIGPLASRIMLETDFGEHKGSLGIPVVGSVVGDFTLFGSKSFDSRQNIVDFPPMTSEDEDEVTIWMAAQGKNVEQIQPEVVKIDAGDALKVTVDAPKDRGSRKLFPIRFEVPKGAPEVYYPGTNRDNFAVVTLRTNLEDAKEVRIFVRLVVKN